MRYRVKGYFFLYGMEKNISLNVNANVSKFMNLLGKVKIEKSFDFFWTAHTKRLNTYRLPLSDRQTACLNNEEHT